jgi:hypothetical protein
MALVALVAGGCLTTELHQAGTAVEAAGFAHASVSCRCQDSQTPQSDGATVTVTADANPALSDPTTQYDTVAKVIWSTLPGTFEYLEVTISTVGTQQFLHEDLVKLFGARHGNLDNTPIGVSVGGISPVFLTLGGVFLLSIVAKFAVVLTAARRSRRDRAPDPEYFTVEQPEAAPVPPPLPPSHCPNCGAPVTGTTGSTCNFSQELLFTAP